MDAWDGQTSWEKVKLLCNFTVIVKVMLLSLKSFIHDPEHFLFPVLSGSLKTKCLFLRLVIMFQVIREEKASKTPKVPIIYPFHASNLDPFLLVYRKVTTPSPPQAGGLCLCQVIQIRLFNEQRWKNKQTENWLFIGTQAISQKLLKILS